MSFFPKFQIKKSLNNQFYWVLYASNVEPILTSSEQYTTKQNCQLSIASSKVCIADSNFLKRTALNGQYYFLQVANNGEALGKSEMYNTSQSRDNGIVSVRRNAPIANVEDTTNSSTFKSLF